MLVIILRLLHTIVELFLFSGTWDKFSLPHNLTLSEKASLHHILHLPTNSWERNMFYHLELIDAVSFTSIEEYCRASLIRTANKTILGWAVPLQRHAGSCKNTSRNLPSWSWCSMPCMVGHSSSRPAPPRGLPRHWVFQTPR